jgi:hypothetical protein
VVELFPSHPVGQNDNQRHVAHLHFVSSLIEVSLGEFKVVLLGIPKAFQRELGHALFTEIITDLPLVVFAVLVQHLNQRLLGVGKVLNFTHLPKDPSLLAMETVNEVVRSEILGGKFG